MKVVEKQFSTEEVRMYEEAKLRTSTEFKLNPVNNVYLILHKLSKNLDCNAVYLECGTFKGNTLITVANFLKEHQLVKNLYGIDTFEGFPITSHFYKDLPDFFIELYNSGSINLDLFEKAKIRTNNFKDISHLEKEYFLDVNSVFDKASKFENIHLIKGTFKDVTPTFDKPIEVLHLDGDLYHSYLTCLKNLYDNVIIGGTIIFDEYYSLKYPGARVAVDEFLVDKKGTMEKYYTPEGFERWCFVKENE